MLFTQHVISKLKWTKRCKNSALTWD
uniref:Uncharacterized protein n=1 Tax=Anguilla anguilla TaxID=7936 RepID=A0A0E9SA06_ANGAN